MKELDQVLLEDLAREVVESYLYDANLINEELDDSSLFDVLKKVIDEFPTNIGSRKGRFL